jgi:hypothetical protein
VNKTIEAAQFCHERGIKIILLTDHLTCPIAQYASVVLKTEPSEQQHSIVPAISIIEAIVIEMGQTHIRDFHPVPERCRRCSKGSQDELFKTLTLSTFILCRMPAPALQPDAAIEPDFPSLPAQCLPVAAAYIPDCHSE